MGCPDRFSSTSLDSITKLAWKKPGVLAAYDDVLRKAVSELTNNRLTEDGWKQATFPVCLGGIGTRSLVQLALPAYLSSVYSSASVVKRILPEYEVLGILEVPMKEWSDRAQAPLPDVAGRTKQKAWDLPLAERIFDSLLQSSTAQGKARLLAVSSRFSGSWLHALPVSTLGNHLDNNTVRISVGLRLGLAICEPHSCACGAAVSELGYHGLSCKKNGKIASAVITRHNRINDRITRSLVTAEYHAIKEPPGLCRRDGKRPDGMTRIPFRAGKNAVYDVTVADTVAQTYLAETSKKAGAAARVRETAKRRHYAELSLQYEFVPLAFETFGAWGEDAVEFLRHLGRKLRIVKEEPRASSFLYQSIAVEMQIGNALCVMGTFANDDC